MNGYQYNMIYALFAFPNQLNINRRLAGECRMLYTATTGGKTKDDDTRLQVLPLMWRCCLPSERIPYEYEGRIDCTFKNL